MRVPETPPRTSLSDAFASPEAKRRYNRRVFHVIAQRYDLITVLLSYGRDRAWKQRLVRMSDVAPGERALDLACGTGDLGLLLAARGARVTALDLTPGMLRQAAVKDTGRQLRFAVADMTHLPIRDGVADVVTAGYGLRNVPRLDRALEEIVRVLRPGGRFLSLDFDRPRNPVVREAFLAYLSVVGSLLGLALHRDADTYRYIAASLRRYPGAPAVADMMREAGFRTAMWTPVLGGLMAIHRATR